jgi:protein dithiol:quinone oxidoreductase
MKPNSIPAPQSTRVLAFMAALCVLALGLALVAQHQFDMRPCPWCVLQRGLYILLVLGFSLSACINHPTLRRSMVALCALLSGAGMASAIYQHQVAAQKFSCNLSLADKIINALELDTALPSIFSATASCAEAAVSVLGLPFAFWSLGLFSAIALGCVWVFLKP